MLEGESPVVGEGDDFLGGDGVARLREAEEGPGSVCYQMLSSGSTLQLAGQFRMQRHEARAQGTEQ